MIKFPDGELLDLLPYQLKSDVDMICLSYALKCAMKKVLAYERSAMTSNFIDSLPEKILDVLAVELRSPYYLDSMDIEVKRKIIKNTLIWHTIAGTRAATAEMVETVFGEGEVIEWPDFDEGEQEPYTFDIVTNARFTEDTYALLLEVIERVKNERSHLRRILIDRWVYMTESVGSGAISSPEIIVTDHPQVDGRNIHRKDSAAAGAISTPDIKLTNNHAERDGEAGGTEYFAAGVLSEPQIKVSNNMTQEKKRDASLSGSAASGAISAPHETIGNTMASVTGAMQGAEKVLAAVLSRPLIRVMNSRESALSVGSANGLQSLAAGAVSYPKTTIQ